MGGAFRTLHSQTPDSRLQCRFRSELALCAGVHIEPLKRDSHMATYKKLDTAIEGATRVLNRACLARKFLIRQRTKDRWIDLKPPTLNDSQ